MTHTGHKNRNAHVEVLYPIRRVESRLAEVVGESPVLGGKANRPEQVSSLVGPMIADEPHEVVVVLYLNARNVITGFYRVSEGTSDSSLVQPREVFGPALRMGASSIVVAHNHPSGDPSPSALDVSVTGRLASCGRLLGCPLVDHVVIGASGSFVSLRDAHPELFEPESL